MTWTIHHTLDVHDERGDIVATAATTEAAARIVAMAERNEWLTSVIRLIEEVATDTPSHSDAVNALDAIYTACSEALATIDGTEGRR